MLTMIAIWLCCRYIFLSSLSIFIKVDDEQMQTILKVYWNMNIIHHEISVCEGKVIWKKVSFLWKLRVHQLYSLFCSLFYLSNVCLKNLPLWYVIAVCFHFQHFHGKLTNVLDAVDETVCRETVKHANSFISWNHTVYLHQSLVKTNLISLSHHFELQTSLKYIFSCIWVIFRVSIQLKVIFACRYVRQ